MHSQPVSSQHINKWSSEHGKDSADTSASFPNARLASPMPQRLQVIRAQHMGFCFGVRDALTAASKANRPEKTVIYGELVHNKNVTESLQDREFQVLAETNRDTVPDRPVVMVTAHGISNKRKQNLIVAGKELIDTTCPLVRRVHEAAIMLMQRDYFVVVIGKPDHVEVLGIVEDLPDNKWAVVQDVTAVRDFQAKQIGIICQTTMPENVADDCRHAISRCNPKSSIRFVNTVCRPTKQRQAAVDQLCKQVPVVIVVGGENSNNTRRLVQRCQSNGCTAYHVQSADDVQASWLSRHGRIGLTAGTSTPDELIDAVEKKLLDLARANSGHQVTEHRMKVDGAWCHQWTNQQWSDYFIRNRQDDPNIPWSTTPTLTGAERSAVAKSVQIFQLGESGEGRNIRRCAREWIENGGDPDYLPALELFMQEENQHADWLAKFLRQEGVDVLRKQWSHRCFRFLRHLAGLRTSISVLVTAEILAQVYYLGLMRSTQSPTLKAICKRVLRDERAHVTFQQNQSCRLAHSWGRLRWWAVDVMENLLFIIARRIVWHEHNAVFTAADMNWASYRTRTSRRWLAARK